MALLTVTFTAGARGNRKKCVSIKEGPNNSATVLGNAWKWLHKTAIVAV